MKARISYQIELDDVPRTIADLINKVHTNITTQADRLMGIQDLLVRNNGNISDVLKMIAEYQIHLSEQVSKLEDYSIILAEAHKTQMELFLGSKQMKQVEQDVIDQIEQQQKELTENNEQNT